MHNLCCSTGTNYISLLKNHGYKITSSRKKILTIIEKKNGPIGAYDIVHIDPSLDTVSVYRCLEILESLHLVHKIQSLNSYIRTDGHSHSHIHYFLICRQCHSLEEKVFETEKHGLSELGIKPDKHCLEIVGLCEECEMK